MFNINVCWWLDSNSRPLELEATVLPTEPQPLPNYCIVILDVHDGVAVCDGVVVGFAIDDGASAAADKGNSILFTSV